MNKIILTFLSVFTIYSSFGQAIQIGTGTTVNTITQASPVNTYFRRQVAQFVYTRAEINAAGVTGANTLSQLGFFITTNPLFNIPGYTVKVKHTNANNASNSLGTTGWTVVKNAFTYAPEPGDFDMLIFDTPFNWNGTQNLAIEICWSQIQPTWDASGQCRIFNSNRGYRYRLDDNAGSICGQTTTTRVNYKPQVRLIFKSTTTWNGSVSTDWFNQNNWDAFVPTQEMNVLIPSGTTNIPIIAAAGAVAKNITIDAGATLTLVGTSNIDIYGDFNNNGTFVANSGNVTLKGENSNNINGSTNQDMFNLTIDNVNGAIINSGSIDLRGTLKVGIATGNFNTNNALTLISDSAGTARIDELTTKCKYTLNMSDAYGDSWNGGFITAYIDNVPVGDFFAKRANSSSDIYVPAGAVLRLQYTAGNYENENSYTLSLNSTVVFSNGPTPTVGTNVFSTTASCSFFNPITGNIVMQRYIDAGATNWRFVTSAVTGGTLADLSSTFITSGFPGADFPNWPTAANPWPSIYFYDETVPGIQDNGFMPATNISNVIGVGEGIWVWSGDTIIGTQPFNMNITGPPNVGNINLPISYTNSGLPADDGWNMVGNPYPSSIDWDSPNITKNGVNNAIYIWNPDLEQFASYVGGFGTNGGSNVIASSQAFWLQTTSPTATVTMRESSKTSVTGTFLRPQTTTPFKIKAQNGFGQDEAIINFDDNATIGFDVNFDALKIPSQNPNLPIISSVMADDYSINQFPAQEINIPIRVLTGVTGIHTISVENIESLTNAACLILEDLYTGINYNLSFTPSFNIQLFDTTTLARFILHIGAPKIIETTEISCINNQDGEIIFTKNSASPFDITWKDGTLTTISSKTNVLSDTLINLNNGTYYIETTDNLCGNIIDTVILVNPLPITAAFSTVKDTFDITEAVVFTNASLNAVDYSWDFGDGNASSQANPSHTYAQIGDYLVSLISSQNSNCNASNQQLITITDNVTSVDEYNIMEDLKIWTQPNLLYIQFKDANYKELEIRDLLGKIVFSKPIFNNNQHTINTSKWSNSIYLVVLHKTNGEREVRKVIVSN